MGRVYAVASAKGGVGKTTTTANLGVTLAAAGHRVAVVDADMAMPNLGRLLGVDVDGPTIHDVLAGDADPLDAVYEGPNGLSVVPGDPSLDAYAKVTPKRLGDVVASLSDYDIVLVDTGAGLSHDTVLPLGLADAVLLVSTPSPDALGDTEKTRQLAERVGASVVGLVLTRVDAGMDAEERASLVETRLVEVVPEDTESGDEGGDQLAVRRDDDGPVTAAYRALGDAVAADAVAAEFEADADAAAGPSPTADADESADDAEDVASDEDADADASPDAAADAVGEAEDADADTGDPSPADVDVSSVLDDPDDGLDTVLSVGDELAAVDDAADESGENSESDGAEDGDVVFEVDEADETDDTDKDTAEAETGDAESGEGGGLASTLEAVEAGDDEGEHDEEADVSAVVKEAEPGADSEGVRFDSAPDTEDEGVTIQPDESLDVPDAEETGDETAEGEDEGEDADGDDADDADEDDADETADGDDADETADGDDADDADGEKKSGLFGRFFG